MDPKKWTRQVVSRVQFLGHLALITVVLVMFVLPIIQWAVGSDWLTYDQRFAWAQLFIVAALISLIPTLSRGRKGRALIREARALRRAAANGELPLVGVIEASPGDLKVVLTRETAWRDRFTTRVFELCVEVVPFVIRTESEAYLVDVPFVHIVNSPILFWPYSTYLNGYFDTFELERGTTVHFRADSVEEAAAPGWYGDPSAAGYRGSRLRRLVGTAEHPIVLVAV